MDLCLAAEKIPVMRLSRRWCEQLSLDKMGIRAGHADVKRGEETGEEEVDVEGE